MARDFVSTAAENRQEMDFAGRLYASIEAAKAENSVDGDLKIRQQGIVSAEAVSQTRKLALQVSDHLANAIADRLRFRPALGQIAKLSWDKNAGHESS